MGRVSSLTIVDSGWGYSFAPSVTISLPDADSANATATATLDSGSVSAITLTDSGYWYVNTPTVTISSPDSGIVSAGSVTIPSVGHILNQNYNTTGGSGTGFIIKSTSSGGLVSFDIIDGGKNYIVGDLVQTVNGDYPATIQIDTVRTGTTATGIAVVDSNNGGRISSITITDSGSDYSSIPSITIDSADGTAADYRATATATLNNSGEIDYLTITDSGGGYITAPTVVISAPNYTSLYLDDSAEQTLASGVVVKGEVVKYSDSDGVLYLAHVGASDGKYHTFVTGRDITFGSVTRYTRNVLAVSEENQISNNEQNDDFSTIADDFLDFTEDNPFGEPS